jgi:hypothetical protein
MKDLTNKINQFTDEMLLSLWGTLDPDSEDMYTEMILDKWLEKYLEEKDVEVRKYNN